MTAISPTDGSTRHIARHYAEMVAAMFAGMFVLGAPIAHVLAALGVSASEMHSTPTAMLLSMAVAMTIPMVGWMRYRGHGWVPSAEMAAAMFVPTFAVIGVYEAGVVRDFNALFAIQHAAMFPTMLAAMLLRRDEYSGPVAVRAG